jgi:hypothetical protein
MLFSFGSSSHIKSWFSIMSLDWWTNAGDEISWCSCQEVLIRSRTQQIENSLKLEVSDLLQNQSWYWVDQSYMNVAGTNSSSKEYKIWVIVVRVVIMAQLRDRVFATTPGFESRPDPFHMWQRKFSPGLSFHPTLHYKSVNLVNRDN